MERIVHFDSFTLGFTYTSRSKERKERNALFTNGKYLFGYGIEHIEMFVLCMTVCVDGH